MWGNTHSSFFLNSNLEIAVWSISAHQRAAKVFAVYLAHGSTAMVCIIAALPHYGAESRPPRSRLMTVARKLKFAAFYFYLKLLRARRVEQVLGPLEQQFFAQASGLREGQAGFDLPEGRSVRNAFWIRGSFADGEIAPQLDALVISRQLKFGNAILQLTNAIQVAQQLGVRKIYHRGFDFLSDRAQAGEINILKGIPENENYLASSFFPNALLARLCTSPELRYQTARKLAPWLTLQHSRAASMDTQRHLYMHIRAGDIFTKSTPHPAYGQPPLAFYTRIVRMEPWEKVVLVFENRLNPVIDALTAFLASERIPCEIQSRDLDADAARLLEAENIVIGRGTFVYPMLCISEKVRRVFCFDSDSADEWGLDKSDIQFVRVVDKTGTYRNSVLKHWLNNEEQRRLMLNYREDELAFAG